MITKGSPTGIPPIHISPKTCITAACATATGKLCRSITAGDSDIKPCLVLCEMGVEVGVAEVEVGVGTFHARTRGLGFMSGMIMLLVVDWTLLVDVLPTARDDDDDDVDDDDDDDDVCRRL